VIVTVVAFVAATVKVEDPPAAIDAGFAEMVTVGAFPVPAVTVTFVFALLDPPIPVAVTV
jgi:hypothetical protein